MTILQVVGRKVAGPENSLRLDVVGFQDVTQENRDVARVVAREVLAAMDDRKGCQSGGEQTGDHRHGLSHGDQVRASYGDFRKHNGLG